MNVHNLECDKHPPLKNLVPRFGKLKGEGDGSNIVTKREMVTNLIRRCPKRLIRSGTDFMRKIVIQMNSMC